MRSTNGARRAIHQTDAVASDSMVEVLSTMARKLVGSLMILNLLADHIKEIDNKSVKDNMK